MSKTKKPANPLLEQKKRRIGPGVVVVVILILALAAGVGVQYWRSNSGVDVSSAGQTEPTVITGPGTTGQGITVGKEGAKAHIDVYLDFRCPHCKDFEEESGAAIDSLVDNGTATVTYWPLMFVNPDSSPRLANAFAAAAAEGKTRSYADELYADFAKSWTDEQLIELGKELGIDDARFQTAIRDNTYGGWLQSVGQAANERKVEGTPAVFVDGKMLNAEQLTPQGITDAVTAAATAG